MNTSFRNKNEDGMTAAELLIPSAVGLGIAAAVSAVLILLVGAVIYSTADPNKLVTGASLAILAAASFAAGFAGAKRGGAILPGIISGAAFALIVLTASLISGGESGIPAPFSYLIRLGALAVSVLGAYLGVRGGGRRIGGAPRRPKIKKR